MRILVSILCLAYLADAIKPLHRARSGDAVPGSYIIRLKDGADLEANINLLKQKMVFQEAVLSRQPKIEHKYTILNGFSAFLSERAVQLIRTFDDVLYIEENAIDRAMQVMQPQMDPPSWGLDRIDQRDLNYDNKYHPITTGKGVTVYVIDTGIWPTHDDFDGRASVGTDIIGDRDGIDCHGHGTHCSGTIGGSSFGVAKEVNIVGVRVLNCLGSGTKSQTIAGMNWVLDEHTPPAVVSMSLGGSVSSSQDAAVAVLFENNIVVSVAAGNNNGDACLGSPSRAHDALSVGATDIADIRASFSNFGDCVDLFAPGVSITSSWRGADDAVNTISGTSMACPHVSGAAALVFSRGTSITAAQVYSTIETEATLGVVIDPIGAPNKLLYVH